MWRYYCDHCGKGGCGKGAMAKHERSCVRNPERLCRMCAHGLLPQRPIATLIEAAHSIPACMLAEVIQAHLQRYSPHDEDAQYDQRPYVDSKAEAARFWAEANERQTDEGPW